MAKKYNAIPRQLSSEEKEFIKLIQAGKKKAEAYRLAFPEDARVTRYMDLKGSKSPEEKAEREHLTLLIAAAAKHKLQTQHMQKATVTYQETMTRLANEALAVAEDLMQNARSEKVRADLAVEFIRQETGTPVQKVQVKEDKTVVLTFEAPRQIIDIGDET